MTKSAKDIGEAFEIQEKYKGEAHGHLQWKGTYVCMDIWCDCGKHMHIDDEFVYHIECPYCGRIYACNGHIELIEVRERPSYCLVKMEKDRSGQIDDLFDEAMKQTELNQAENKIKK